MLLEVEDEDVVLVVSGAEVIVEGSIEVDESVVVMLIVGSNNVGPATSDDEVIVEESTEVDELVAMVV